MCEKLNDEQKLFFEIMVGNKPIKECELTYKVEPDNYRLYVNKENNRFHAHAVQFDSCIIETGKDYINDWENPKLVVTTLFEVRALYDGIRHLEFNRNNGESDGYLYYPPTQDLINMLQKVKEVEIEICKDA